MRLKLQRILSFVLCLCMVLSALGGISFAKPSGGSGNEGANDLGKVYTHAVKIIPNLKVTTGKPYATANHIDIHTVFTVQFAKSKEADIVVDELGTLYEKEGVYKFFKSEDEGDAISAGYTKAVGKQPDGDWSVEYLVDMHDAIGHPSVGWGGDVPEAEVYYDASERRAILSKALKVPVSGFKDNAWTNAFRSFKTFSEAPLLNMSGYKEAKVETGTDSNFIMDTGMTFTSDLGGYDPEMYKVNEYQYWGIVEVIPEAGSELTQADIDALKREQENVDNAIVNYKIKYKEDPFDRALVAPEDSAPQDEKEKYKAYTWLSKQIIVLGNMVAEAENKKSNYSGENFMLYTTFYDAKNKKSGNTPDLQAFLNKNGDPHGVGVGRLIHQKLGSKAAGWDSFQNFSKTGSGGTDGNPPLPYNNGGDVPQWRLSKYFQEAPFKLNIEVSVPSDPSYKTVSSPDEVEGSNPPKGSWKHSFLEAHANINKTKVLLSGGGMYAYENPIFDERVH